MSNLPELKNLQDVGEHLKRELRLSGRKHSSVRSYYYVLKDMENLGISPKTMSSEDAKNLRSYWLENVSESTANLRTAVLKRMMKIIHYGDNYQNVNEYPDCVKPLRTGKINGNNKVKNILSKEEIKKMVRSARNQRDRALFITLYESGCRPDEFLAMDIGDIEFDKYGAVIYIREKEGLDLKTGERRIRVFEATSDLQFWLNQHPFNKDKKQPVWIRTDGKEWGRLGYSGLKYLIKSYTKKIGRDDVSPHTLRHSRASHLARFLTEAQMCEFFGWVHGSDMPRVYIHMSGRDVDTGLFKAHGIEVEEEDKEDEKVLDQVECPRCKARNPGDFQFCGKCGMILDEDVAVKAEMAEKEHTVELMSDVANRPNVDDKMKRVEKILDMVEKYPKLAEMLEKEVSETEV